MKTVCLFGPNLPRFFLEGHAQSEALENYAIDLWHAGFGVLASHLNAPRAEGLDIPETLLLGFDFRAIKEFCDAVFVMPGWEDDESVWKRVIIAGGAGKPVFDSLGQIVRWRDGRGFASLAVTAPLGCQDQFFVSVPKIKIVFVVGKYFVGEKKNGILIPVRNAIHQNILAANQVAVMLVQERVWPFTPHNNTHHFELKTKVGEPTYQAFDQLLLERLIDGLVILPSWVNSTGAPKEVALAQRIGKPVIHSYDLQSIRNWRDGKGPVNVIKTIEV